MDRIDHIEIIFDLVYKLSNIQKWFNRFANSIVTMVFLHMVLPAIKNQMNKYGERLSVL